MAKSSFISGLRKWLLSRRNNRSVNRKNHRFAGFTLIELLVSVIIGAIITASLLSLVVNLTDTNQKDTARSETQRDMQLAMNYIAQDLRESIYVYDGECLQGTGTITDANLYPTSCPGLANFIPASVATGGAGGASTPILAFWRTDLLPEAVRNQCATAAQNSPNSSATSSPLKTLVNGGTPCVSGKSYTLVVYALVDDTSTADIWQGKARIVRYQLPQFNFDGTSNVGAGGWVDPLPDTNSSFQQWPYRIVNGAVQAPASFQAGYARPAGNPDVLVDFVDDSTTASSDLTCQSPSRITPNVSPVPSFFACVRGNTMEAQRNSAQTQELGVNQEILVSLTGNAAGRAGIPVSTTGDNLVSTRLAPLQTRVLSRGILNKSPD